MTTQTTDNPNPKPKTPTIDPATCEPGTKRHPTCTTRTRLLGPRCYVAESLCWRTHAALNVNETCGTCTYTPLMTMFVISPVRGGNRAFRNRQAALRQQYETEATL